MEPLDDEEIHSKVQSVAGKEVKVVGCEKSAASENDEKLLINGFLVPLQGEEGKRIKESLLAGVVPPCDLLNSILLRAGILKNPVELEAVTNIKKTTKTLEKISYKDKHGRLVDERTVEFEADDESRTSTTEVWRTEQSATNSL